PVSFVYWVLLVSDLGVIDGSGPSAGCAEELAVIVPFMGAITAFLHVRAVLCDADHHVGLDIEGIVLLARWADHVPDASDRSIVRHSVSPFK
ncbi:hypothetical protein, partial [uncultured Tateyamaria sp.]|uniref:hypothetical protein n=1 Tax=uncultured Tateyamaria sp. TaxID=455651 RepID=UPI00262D800C